MERHDEKSLTREEPSEAALVAEEATAGDEGAAEPPAPLVEGVTPYDELWFRCRPGSP